MIPPAIDTNLILRGTRNTARVLRIPCPTKCSRARGEKSGMKFSEIAPLVAGARSRQAMETGNIDAGLVSASQVVELVDDIPSCKELIGRFVAECASRIERLSRNLMQLEA